MLLYYVVVTGGNGCTTISNTFSYTTTGIIANSTIVVSVGPNPASTSIRVKASEALVGKSFDMYDALGKKVFSARIEKIKSDFDVSVLEPGIYFYTAGNYTGKLVISK